MEDYKKLIDEACKKLEEDYIEFEPVISGFFKDNKLNITVKTIENEEIIDKHLDLYYDIFYYLEMETEGKKYHFELIINDNEDDVINHVVMETDMSFMPDTGGVTEEDWNNYVKQLVYTINGVKQKLKEPDIFFEEE